MIIDTEYIFEVGKIYAITPRTYTKNYFKRCDNGYIRDISKQTMSGQTWDNECDFVFQGKKYRLYFFIEKSGG